MAQGLPHTSLPLFPTKPLGAEELDRFSDHLIDAYWNLRITTPYPRTLGIKHVRIQLPPVQSEGADHSRPAPAEKLAEPDSRSDVVAPIPTAQTHDAPAEKCFLHPKPKGSCARCQKYVSSRHAPGEMEPSKRQRPSYPCWCCTLRYQSHSLIYRRGKLLFIRKWHRYSLLRSAETSSRVTSAGGRGESSAVREMRACKPGSVRSSTPGIYGS